MNVTLKVTDHTHRRHDSNEKGNYTNKEDVKRGMSDIQCRNHSDSGNKIH